jgi:hypothetical protein
MDFTQEQITQRLCEFSTKKDDGFQNILKTALEVLMRSDREEFNIKEGDVSNVIAQCRKTKTAKLNGKRVHLCPLKYLKQK